MVSLPMSNVEAAVAKKSICVLGGEVVEKSIGELGCETLENLALPPLIVDALKLLEPMKFDIEFYEKLTVLVYLPNFLFFLRGR